MQNFRNNDPAASQASDEEVGFVPINFPIDEVSCAAAPCGSPIAESSSAFDGSPVRHASRFGSVPATVDAGR